MPVPIFRVLKVQSLGQIRKQLCLHSCLLLPLWTLILSRPSRTATRTCVAVRHILLELTACVEILYVVQQGEAAQPWEDQ
jgi:hypothetical protein